MLLSPTLVQRLTLMHCTLYGLYPVMHSLPVRGLLSLLICAVYEYLC